MTNAATIENGFAEVGAGAWLASRGQPVASFGEAVRRHRKGWIVRDRTALELVETPGRAFFADAARPFLTHIPCAAPISAVSSKVLLAPAAARTGAELLKVVPMSIRHSLCVTHFAQPLKVEGLNVESLGNLQPSTFQPSTTSHFVILATASRTRRIAVEDGETLSVAPQAVAAWTGNRPTGFVRRLGVMDILLPRMPRGLMLHFHGPCIVWLEGANHLTTKLPNHLTINRRSYGV
ncbi:MAG: hypothetical protein IJ783_06360 [Kiritimatiellae bacterium]|nr:hypothetical protein [Kiritimatiellia bacterium]